MSQRADLVLRPSVPVARYLYWEACDEDQSREMLDRNMQRGGIGNDGDGLGLHRIAGRCDGRNIPSARVMERLGMRREAHFRENEIFKGEWGDEFVCAILEHEWRARRR